ncbi:MAG: family 10 glycosylhydrolase [Clostridiales bacterium]|nr:family 10 glycosylhydrolase [Clostridiales bacterium]
MKWWEKNNLRMIQNNIRDIDAMMDIDKHIEWLKSFDANVLEIGCGGITAFHPTELECQYPSPYMKGDFFKEVVEKCHANNIRVIARFDFSKTHESFYEKHSDWYSRKKDGSPIRYHDTVATCVNGEYQRELSLKIIEEVLRKYQVDGIFFNMFGYVTHDYSGNYIGICQCKNCKKRFYEMYGEVLPTKEDMEDPAFLKYLEFKKITVNEMLDKIRNVTKAISTDIAISTYATHGVDIVRNESNSALDRPLPFWVYSSSDNVGQIEGGYDDKISSNCAINAVDLPYRFMGVSKYLNQVRLYENIAAGSGLDWCIIGDDEDYPDYENFETVRKVFRFHKKYEEYYGHFDQRTKIMLVYSNDGKSLNAEYRGLFRMFKEEHILFTIMDSNALEAHIEEFNKYDFVFLPDVPDISYAVGEALKNTTACVIASGGSIVKNRVLIKELFGVELSDAIKDVRGTYFRTEPKADFPDFQNKQWVFLDGFYYKMTLGGDVTGMLPKVEKAAFGPPERCFGHKNTDEMMASFGHGGNIYIPWGIGTLYYKYGYGEFRRLMLDIMSKAKPIPRAFNTNAPEMVEMFFAKCDASTYMLQLINLTSFNGMTFFKPFKLNNIDVTFNEIAPKSIEELTESGKKPVSYDGKMIISMDEAEIYKAFIISI